MPEGPECRHRAMLLKERIGKKIEKVIILESSRYKKGEIFINEEIENIFVNGKITYFVMKNFCFRIHYGMEGNLVYEKTKHSHIEIIFEDKTLYFHDTRKFGKFEIIESYQKDIEKNGEDIFEISEEKFLSVMRKFPKKEIAGILLDQKIISGIGNYLRAEILYDAEIFPGAIIKTLSDTEILSILFSSRKICNESLSLGGCTLKTYVDVLGNQGKFKCKVYGISFSAKFKDKRTMFYDPEKQIIGKL